MALWTLTCSAHLAAASCDVCAPNTCTDCTDGFILNLAAKWKNSRATQLSTKREGLGKPANVQPLIALQPRISARKNVSKKKKTGSISYSTSTECEFA